MAKALTLSIVIPAYNEEAYIELCLNAIAKQTVRPDEVIVVDNNSSDATAKLAQQYPFVTLISEKRQGLYYSRQTGMSAASGDILCRIDADTVIDSHWVETVKASFRDKTVGALTGTVGYHDFAAPLAIRKVEDILLRGAIVLDNHFLFGCNMAVRKNVWTKYNHEFCADGHIMEDVDIALHLRHHGITPVYNPEMSVFVSARRAADGPSEFWNYIRGHSRTMRHHGQPVLGAMYAELCFMSAYCMLKPLHMMYDPQKRKFRLSRMLERDATRPDPMAISAE